MEKHTGEDLKNKLNDINKNIEEISQGIDDLKFTFDNINTAQGIINALKETAEIVNTTVNPMEFFDGYEKMYYLVDKLESVPDIEYSQQPPNEIREELRGQRKPAIEKMIGRYYKYAMSMNCSTDAFYNTLSRYFSYMDNDHKNYINQLCKNGNKNRIDNAEKIRKFKEFYMNFSYIINQILFPYAKIAFAIWTFLWVMGTKSFLNDFPYILLGYIILCGIADLIYFANEKKYARYKMKIIQKKINRLKKLMQQVDPVAYQREYGNAVNQPIRGKSVINYDYMEGHQFEYFCADVLRKNGFKNVEVTKGSGDQGIDIIAFKDGIKYGIQCKCYSSDIGNKAVQEAFSGKTFYNCHVGAVLTNRYFTASAKELAEKNGILLWDRDYLEKLIESSPS